MMDDHVKKVCERAIRYQSCNSCIMLHYVNWVTINSIVNVGLGESKIIKARYCSMLKRCHASAHSLLITMRTRLA